VLGIKIGVLYWSRASNVISGGD